MSKDSTKNKTPLSPLLNKQQDNGQFAVYTSPSPQSFKSGHSLPKGTSSILGVTQNMVNCLVGAGILGIPSVYATSGIFGGLILMIIFAILCTYTMNLLIKTSQKLNVSEYEELGRVAFGAPGYICAAASLFLMDFGTLINYLIILGDAAFKVAEIWGYDKMIDRRMFIIIISMVLIFPPCLFRSISLYEKFSFVKFIGIIAVICAVIYQWFSYRVLMHHKEDGYVHRYGPSKSDIVWLDMTQIPSAVGIIAYTFVCHDTAFLCYNTLFNPTTLRWSKTVMLSIGSAMFLSLILSIPAYLTFGSSVEGNILNNYPIHQVSMITTRIIYVIMMALTFPTAFFVVRHVVYVGYVRLLSLIKIYQYKRNRKKVMRIAPNIINMDAFIDDTDEYAQRVLKNETNVMNSPLIEHLIFTSILFFIPLTLSMFLTDLGATMSIIGNLSGMTLAFVLPTFTYIKASEYGFWSWIYVDSIGEKWKAWSDIWPPFILAWFGIFIAVYGVVLTLNAN